MGILRRNWKRLAEPLKKFDAEIVREFYSNAYVITLTRIKIW